MKIHQTPNNGTLIIGDNNPDSSLENFSHKADTYLQLSKNTLPKMKKDILACEEKLKDMDVPSEFHIEGTYGGWGFYTIKNKEVQEYGEKIDRILDTFYSYVEKESKDSLTDQSQMSLLLNIIHQRKSLVKIAVLDKIRTHQMDKLVHEYDNGEEKYDCSPMEIGTIHRGEKTFVSHIFNPIADIEIVTRVGGHSGGGISVRDICISKDVFSPKNEVTSGDEYLANLMGHETKQDLVLALKKGEEGVNEDGKKVISIAKIIKRATETN